MGNLFRGWPIDRIAQIHTDMGSIADYSVCENYLYIQGSSVRLSSFRPRALARNILLVFRFALGKDETCLHWIRMRNVLKWSRQFDPEVIYARPLDSHTFYLGLTRRLSRELHIPYVTHIMDDWPARFGKRTGLVNELIWKPLLRCSLQSLFSNAAINMGISEEMCKAYEKRYSRDFVPFHNCIDISEWSSVRKNYDIGGDFHLVYIGVVTADKELHSLVMAKFS